MTGKELTDWREDRGLNQGQLAKLLDVHIITVNRWENGARAIPKLLSLALETVARNLPRRAAKKPRKK